MSNINATARRRLSQGCPRGNVPARRRSVYCNRPPSGKDYSSDSVRLTPKVMCADIDQQKRLPVHLNAVKAAIFIYYPPD
mmetsp:Transcript_47219/g.75832  ORF Transcript_47219/g.75832 Transcript_47219/m.75832 type:complete len:80 (+) Transcript_47219:1413-1652(+)